MTTHPTVRQSSRLLLLLPLLIVGIALTVAQVDSAEPEPDKVPVEITATSPLYNSLEDLAAASDLVVIGTVTDALPGRTISDPSNPDAAIATTLFSVEIERVLHGTETDRVTIEHETALADNTPIIINGRAPPAVGERGLYFLIGGDSDQFPHHAIASEQGHYLLEGDQLRAAGSDLLSLEMDAFDEFGQP